MYREQLKGYINRHHREALILITKYERGEITREDMCTKLWGVFKNMATATTGHVYRTREEEQYWDAIEAGAGDWL